MLTWLSVYLLVGVALEVGIEVTTKRTLRLGEFLWITIGWPVVLTAILLGRGKQ